MEKAKPVGIWIRVSTEDQAKGVTNQKNPKLASFSGFSLLLPHCCLRFVTALLCPVCYLYLSRGSKFLNAIKEVTANKGPLYKMTPFKQKDVLFNIMLGGSAFNAD